MGPLAPELQRSFALSRDWQASQGASLNSHVDRIPVILNVAEQLRRASRGDLALKLLEPWKSITPRNAQLWFGLALAFWDDQQMKQAKKAIGRACRIAPDQKTYQFAKAQILYEMREAGASEAFRTALKKDPGNLQIANNLASSFASDGDLGTAKKILEQELAHNPDWIQGHNTLSTLRSTHGDTDIYESFSQGVRSSADPLSIYLAWFYQAGKRQDWETGQIVLTELLRLSPASEAVRSAKAYLLSETQSEQTYSNLFSDTEHLKDVGLDICRVRYALKTGELDRATKICLERVNSTSAQMFYPYLSLCWRLLGDDRFTWLEQDGEFIKTYQLTFASYKMRKLRNFITNLHTMNEAYPEQSVKSGTQTDRNLFLTDIPEINDIRNAILDCVRDYVSALPPHDPSHPFLGAQRDVLKFSGSWSVRFSGEGFHRTHTHPEGWISSACYFAFPNESERGPKPAGYLKFGAPPLELGLSLEPYKWIKPEVGNLVLFPSYTWHGTEPIQGGERMTIAFDIK